MSEKLIISTAPHVKTARTTKKIMLDVLIALIPATAAGIVFFGYAAAIICVISLASAFLTELGYYCILHKVWRNGKRVFKDFLHQFDFTTLISGLLLVLVLPASLEIWYLPILGNLFSIAVVKMLFGGTGKNVVNPAIGGRIFLFISFQTLMTAYPAALFGTLFATSGTLMTGATSLTSGLAGEGTLSALDLFLGTGVAGCIGETCKLALLLGGIYLCVRGVIKWYLPLLFIAATGLFAVCLEGFDFSAFLPSIFGGGLILGAIFMATDYTTSPKSTLGNVIYFVLLGILTAGLRKATGVEVVSFVIFLMNLVVFLIDKFIPVRPFGYRREKRRETK